MINENQRKKLIYRDQSSFSWIFKDQNHHNQTLIGEWNSLNLRMVTLVIEK